MRMCLAHWEGLRDAISERGLDELVAKDGVRAAQNMVSAANGGLTIANFDPLMYAHNQIVARGMDMVGIALMMNDEDGNERCPVCFLSAEHDRMCSDPMCMLPKDGTAFDGWITAAATDARMTADRLLADA